MRCESLEVKNLILLRSFFTCFEKLNSWGGINIGGWCFMGER